MTAKKGWQQTFLQKLAETSNVSAACRKAKISRKNAYQERNQDALFRDSWQEALEVATEALELEARRRAEKGVLEPVFHQGAQVGNMRRYSDTLMIFLLKAHRPDMYRDNTKHEHGGEITMRVVYGDDGTDDPAA